MKTLSELISLDSSENQDKIIEYIKIKLENKVKEIKIIKNKTNKKISLIAGINTELSNVSPIVLSGHIDTVPASLSENQNNPFVATQVDDRLYGLGTIDMKSFTAIILDNIETLSKLPYPIIFTQSTDEETNLNCIETIISMLKNLKITPKFTIIGEPTNSTFKLKSKGCYEYVIDFYGKTCHSSVPSNGINSICIASKLITFIEETQKQFDLTSNCAVISGGEATNKVPEKATFKFDIRSFDENQVKLFIKSIKNKLKSLKAEYVGFEYKLQNTLKIPAFYNKNIKKMQNIIKLNKNSDTTFLGGCEAGYFTNYSGDAVIYGVGDLNLAHKPNEYVNINEYKTYSKNLLKLVEKSSFYYQKNR